MKTNIFSILFIFFTAIFLGGSAIAADINPKVVLETSKGKIVLELYPDKAPETVKNFLSYVDAKFYDGMIFHRVIPKFMIQGGGFTTDMKRKTTQAPINNEADKGLKNDRGTIAMARTGDPHSATAQFFINTINNDFLNHKSKTQQGWGYAAFGKVIEGMKTVDAISAVKTTTRGSYRDVPVEPVVIKSAKRLK
ncbi:MAG: peptidyl-prolyl cis-trans isomerase [Deltaproteobacteria bacterium]|jgi:peptidyl-prolyl cis-trans isomerase B (cyclophilin B)|nr:peptidyl-prolyl cis-trans isomerase [Deltaproteobacteria bacterium]